jgi:hypothetical protein
VHAKDTRLKPEVLALDGRIEIRPAEDFTQRAWNYVTLGRGHDEAWWRRFCQALSTPEPARHKQDRSFRN